MIERTKLSWCPVCHGSGWDEYIVNPDNGFLDTQIHNLRTAKTKCERCNGTGKVKSAKETGP